MIVNAVLKYNGELIHADLRYKMSDTKLSLTGILRMRERKKKMINGKVKVERMV